MAKVLNDNNDPWISLAGATEKLLKFDEQKKEDGSDDGSRRDEDVEQQKRHRDYVDQRLRDLRTFEKLVSGTMRRR